MKVECLRSGYVKVTWETNDPTIAESVPPSLALSTCSIAAYLGNSSECHASQLGAILRGRPPKTPNRTTSGPLLRQLADSLDLRANFYADFLRLLCLVGSAVRQPTSVADSTGRKHDISWGI